MSEEAWNEKYKLIPLSEGDKTRISKLNQWDIHEALVWVHGYIEDSIYGRAANYMYPKLFEDVSTPLGQMLVKMKRDLNHSEKILTGGDINSRFLSLQQKLDKKRFREWLKAYGYEIDSSLECLFKDWAADYKAEQPKELSNVDSNPKECEYSTPYIQIMLKVIQEQNITNDNQPLKDSVLVPAFIEKLKAIGERAPKSKAEMMATLVRLPESQKGGNREFKNLKRGSDN
jgi:hypothetical protein